MKDDKAEFDMLEYRFLNSRAARASTRTKPEPKEEKAQEKPEIHVHIDMPEHKMDALEKPEVVKVESPRVWKFKHKYDVYNKLIETIATAE